MIVNKNEYLPGKIVPSINMLGFLGKQDSITYLMQM